MNANGKVRPCDLARRWGINPSYITRLVKRGCPLTSFEEADTWRMANAPPLRSSLVMTDSGGRSLDALNDAEIVIDADANSDRPESVLVRHRENELECWQALRRARDTGTPAEALAATRNYNEASAARMKTETAYEVYLEKTGTFGADGDGQTHPRRAGSPAQGHVERPARNGVCPVQPGQSRNGCCGVAEFGPQYPDANVAVTA